MNKFATLGFKPQKDLVKLALAPALLAIARGTAGMLSKAVGEGAFATALRAGGSRLGQVATKEIAGKELAQRGVAYMSRTWGEPVRQALQSGTKFNTIVEGTPMHRPALGFSSRQAVGALNSGTGQSTILKPLGNLAHNLNEVAFGKGGNIFTRGAGVIKNEFQGAGFYSKPGEGAFKGKTLIYKRSPVGNVISKALGTGAGFGATSIALDKTNPDGTPKSTTRRVAGGVGTAAGWGIAPQIMFPASLVGAFRMRGTQQDVQ